MTSSVTFNEARSRAIAWDAENAHRLGSRRLWIRDLYGRITLVIEGLKDCERSPIAEELYALLGAHAHPNAVQLSEESFFANRSPFDLPNKEPIGPDGRSFFLERYVTGADWLAGLLANEQPTPPRAVLFGLKGGVGRSTALAVWARHLAGLGKRVLVVDLDLEAPGLGSILLRPQDRMRFGLVDWFVESAVGQGDAVFDEMVTRSPLGRDTDGEICVAPACGRNDDSYLRKLNRVYLDLPGDKGPVTFADRVGLLIDALETRANPDVVLIDSRAGLQDTAAVALTRLGAENFLFAVDTPQTWDGYSYLFSHWRNLHVLDRPVFDSLRERIQMVAGQVPEIDAHDYLARFQANSYQLFLSHLYDSTEPDAEIEGIEPFAYDLASADAPHQPIRINWSRAFQDYDPQNRPEAVSPPQLHAAFGEFCEAATSRLFGERESK